MFVTRELKREEIEQIWTIDRSEEIEKIYYSENGELVLKPERYHMTGWPPGEGQIYTPLLYECYDHGGWFYAVFDDSRLIAVAILESRFIGKAHDQLQLKFLHVSSAYRKSGWGKRLFDLARQKACEKGAKALYISATPSENTIDFYLRQGCAVTREPDPELFALEPEDIHLECPL